MRLLRENNCDFPLAADPRKDGKGARFVLLVHRTDDEREWYRYVISQGDKPIVGLRQGSKRSVKAAIEEVVLRMNERRLGKTGRPSASRKTETTTEAKKTKQD